MELKYWFVVIMVPIILIGLACIWYIVKWTEWLELPDEDDLNGDDSD